MKRKIGSKWISFKMTQLYCIDFAGYGTDRQGVIAEIAAAEREICGYSPHSLLMACDLSQTEMMEEVIAFINQRAAAPDSPFRKVAFVGVSAFRRFWYRYRKGVKWPKNARFFAEYEQAKNWLVEERF